MKKKIFCGIALCIATQAFATGLKPPLAFFKKTTFPKTTDGGTTTFHYTLLNNTPITLPLTISTPTVSSGSISLNSNTCGATLASSANCALIYTFTAPANSSSTPLDIRGSFQIAYNGRYPLTDNNIRFIVPKDAPAFTEQPNFSPAITVPSDGTYTLRYSVKNNLSATITSVSFSPTVSSGTIVANGGTCGTSITGGATCTKTFLFTAPTNSGSTDINITGTMTLNYTDVGAQTLAGDNLAFSITPGPKASITVLQHSLMFPNRDFGNSSSYTGTITISNNAASDVSNIARTTTGVTFVSSTCTFPLTPGSTCTDTYSSSIPISTSATVQLTPSNSRGSGNAVIVPVSALGVVALAPPTDTSVGLTLANGCTDTTNDGGLVMVTNNSNEPISDISINASGLSGTTITNPAFSQNSNVYCNGQQLEPNGYCEFRASSSTNTTGEIDIFGHLVTSNSTAHHYELQAKVISAASPFSYTFNTQANGGTIFVATNSCNLVEVVSNSDHHVTPDWSNAASYCSGSISGFSDWRLMDQGPVIGSHIGGLAYNLIGEPSVLNNNNSPLAGMSVQDPNGNCSPPSCAGNYWGGPETNSVGWLFSFGPIGSNPASASELNKDSSLYFTRCVRAFTTNSDGT